jgi:hypothetical protein
MSSNQQANQIGEFFKHGFEDKAGRIGSYRLRPKPTVFFSPSGCFIERVGVPQQSFIERQRSKNIGFPPIRHEKLIFQPEAPDSRFPGVRFDAEEHARL